MQAVSKIVRLEDPGSPIEAAEDRMIAAFKALQAILVNPTHSY